MTSQNQGAPSISDEELSTLEAAFRKGLRDRSFDGLNILGYGEIGVAVGWPFDSPRMVVKRLPSDPDPAESQEMFAWIRRYESAIEPHLTLTPTDHRTITAEDGWTVPFMVQPLLPRHTLVETILAETEPEADHPILVAIRDTLLAIVADGRQALDGQVSNFAWADGRLEFFDTGSPLLYDDAGEPEVRIGSYARVLPSALMPVVRRSIVKVANQMGGPRGTLTHTALSVLRVDQHRWLDAVLATFNTVLDEPLTAAEIEDGMAKTHGEMKIIKRAARLQRAWATTVRRQPYDVFITDSFTHEIL
ncbi:MAG: DUF6206 family protein [Actinomycetota bacterium]